MSVLGSTAVTAIVTALSTHRLSSASALKAQAEAMKVRMETRKLTDETNADLETVINERVKLLLDTYAARVASDELKIATLSAQVETLRVKLEEIQTKLAIATKELDRLGLLSPPPSG